MTKQGRRCEVPRCALGLAEELLLETLEPTGPFIVTRTHPNRALHPTEEGDGANFLLRGDTKATRSPSFDSIVPFPVHVLSMGSEAFNLSERGIETGKWGFCYEREDCRPTSPKLMLTGQSLGGVGRYQPPHEPSVIPSSRTAIG